VSRERTNRRKSVRRYRRDVVPLGQPEFTESVITPGGEIAQWGAFARGIRRVLRNHPRWHRGARIGVLIAPPLLFIAAIVKIVLMLR
jgi:hypothetical protein